MTWAYFLNLATNGLIEGLLVGLLALAITLSFGVARFPNAAAGDVATVGAYSAWAAQAATGSIVLAGLSSVALAAVTGLACWWFVFRHFSGKQGVYALISSIGIAFMLRATITFFLGHDQQVFQIPITRAIVLGPVRIIPTDLWVAGIALAAMIGVFLLLKQSSMGRRMRAIADNPDLARASGIPATKVMAALWLLSGALSGLAGFLLGIKTVVSPEMGFDLLLPAFAATILGTIGSPLGAVVGGVLIGLAQELSTPFVGFTYKIAIGFVVMLLILLFKPEGLFGGKRRIR